MLLLGRPSSSAPTVPYVTGPAHQPAARTYRSAAARREVSPEKQLSFFFLDLSSLPASVCRCCFLFRVVRMATLRSLKMKTATCRRVVKELRSYEVEVEEEAAKTAAMKERGADPYDLKQQVINQSSTCKACSLFLS